jgi:hypothetical protein
MILVELILRFFAGVVENIESQATSFGGDIYEKGT